MIQDHDNEEKEAKPKWSTITQYQILRIHGLPLESDWDSPKLCIIWKLYQESMSEGSSGAAKIIKVFNALFDEEPSLKHGHRETPPRSPRARPKILRRAESARCKVFRATKIWIGGSFRWPSSPEARKR
jgi:hypothetical protein